VVLEVVLRLMRNESIRVVNPRAWRLRLIAPYAVSGVAWIDDD
jgi:hypothetical protein